MPNDASKKRAIQLNNFLHRIDCKTAIIELVTQQGCTLKRIRRSKNWLLTGKQNQLVEISKQLQQEAITLNKVTLDKTNFDKSTANKKRWIAEAINKSLPKPSFDLTAIVQSTPDITINRLIAETGCTLIEARAAMDKAEDLNWID
ncbi:ribosome recycling factor family protein [Psychromonas algarum]|uniref:ribosome recycling factor family protein n=1 Tax=Psychromonas algarum TaxID=2555643 RepID=UPI001FB9D9ED|nr:ribosome recycling factor family protein [Psychromonas sp. RZ22]